VPWNKKGRGLSGEEEHQPRISYKNHINGMRGWWPWTLLRATKHWSFLNHKRKQFSRVLTLLLLKKTMILDKNHLPIPIYKGMKTQKYCLDMSKVSYFMFHCGACTTILCLVCTMILHFTVESPFIIIIPEHWPNLKIKAKFTAKLLLFDILPAQNWW
jgi:hypothetical protein